MKKDLHPKYGEAVVTCACGEVWHIKSTRPEYKVGICAKCHPFFTGKQKFGRHGGPYRQVQPPLQEAGLIRSLYGIHGPARSFFPAGLFWDLTANGT